MKLEQHEKQAIRIIFGISVCLVMYSLLSGCSKEITGPEGPKGGQGVTGAAGQTGAAGSDGETGSTGSSGLNGATGATGATGSDGLNGINGATGDTGPQGYGTGITTTQLSPGATCANGGVQLETYQDMNNNGVRDGEEPLLELNYVCNGLNGANGQDGSNGSNTTFSIIADLGVNCSNGGFDVTFTDAYQSQTECICNGDNGINEANGNAGTNGTNGTNGGTVSFSFVQAIEPCGANSSPWKEVILGLAGGQLLSDFSDNSSGVNTRFSFIPNGSYIDTDSSGCNFSVTGNGVTTSSISWGAGSNSYSSWPAGGYSWTPSGGWVSL